MAHLNTLKTLLRQDIAIRGHTDDDSNIIQFNRDKAIDHEGLNLLLNENQYLSHDILVEQEEALVLSARRRLIDEINASKFYAIICDESSDISKTEQLSFSVRHCTENYDILEDFIGVMPCDGGLSSEALLKYVQDILVRCNIDTQKMAGMAFDGESAMKRLAVLLKNEVCKHALYIHCFAHCNELVFKDVTSLSRLVTDAQDFCENMYALAGVSPRRILLFQNIQKELAEENMDIGGDGGSSLKLKNLSRTRWTTRGAAADVILKKNLELQKTLKTLSTDASVTPECREKSKGLLQRLKSLPNMFNLVAMNELAFLLENNSKQLQRVDLTAEQARTSINKTYIRLEELRSSEEFERLFEKARKINELHQDDNNQQHEKSEEPRAKRKRAIPTHMSNYVVHSSTPIAPATVNEKDELRRQLYETLDSIKEAIKTRFDQDDLEVLNEIKSCLITVANKDYSSSDKLLNKLSGLSEIIDSDDLKNELEELPVYIKLHNRESEIPLLKVTKVSTICDVLTNKQSFKETYPKLTSC